MFSFTYTPLQGVIPAEALETTMRAKGLALSGIIVSAIGFINQFAGPIGLGNIKYKYIYIFVGWDVVESVLWYIFGSVRILNWARIRKTKGSYKSLTSYLSRQCRIPRSVARGDGLGVSATISG